MRHVAFKRPDNSILTEETLPSAWTDSGLTSHILLVCVPRLL